MEAWNEPDTWRAIALQGLCRLVRGTVGLTIDIVAAGPGLPPRVISPLDVGWTSESVRERYYHYLTSGEITYDPGAMALAGLHERVRFITRTRRQMVDDDTWYAAPAVNIARKSGDVDDFICTTVTPRKGVITGFIVYRPWEATPFGERERRIARLLHIQLLRLMIEPAEIDHGPRLSPRLKQTLDNLLAGDSVKQIAQKLDLSPHTVGDYVKALHQKFNVRTRGELLSLCHAQQRRPYLKLPLEMAEALSATAAAPV